MNELEKLGYKYMGKGVYFGTTTTYEEYRKQDGDIVRHIYIDKKECQKRINFGNEDFTHAEILALAKILKENKSK